MTRVETRAGLKKAEKEKWIAAENRIQKCKHRSARPQKKRKKNE